jgi:hypothetical protein
VVGRLGMWRHAGGLHFGLDPRADSVSARGVAPLLAQTPCPARTNGPPLGRPRVRHAHARRAPAIQRVRRKSETRATRIHRVRRKCGLTRSAGRVSCKTNEPARPAASVSAETMSSRSRPPACLQKDPHRSAAAAHDFNRLPRQPPRAVTSARQLRRKLVNSGGVCHRGAFASLDEEPRWTIGGTVALTSSRRTGGQGAPTLSPAGPRGRAGALGQDARYYFEALRRVVREDPEAPPMCLATTCVSTSSSGASARPVAAAPSSLARRGTRSAAHPPPRAPGG